MTEDDYKFQGVVKSDVTAHTSEEEAAWLRSDEVIQRFVEFLEYLDASLTAQLEAFDMGLSSKDSVWRRSSGVFLLRVKARLAEVRPLLADRNKRELDLRAAIVDHQLATLDADVEPTEADRALWERARP